MRRSSYGIGVGGGSVGVDFVYSDHEALGSTTGFPVTFRTGRGELGAGRGPAAE